MSRPATPNYDIASVNEYVIETLDDFLDWLHAEGYFIGEYYQADDETTTVRSIIVWDNETWAEMHLGYSQKLADEEREELNVWDKEQAAKKDIDLLDIPF